MLILFFNIQHLMCTYYYYYFNIIFIHCYKASNLVLPRNKINDIRNCNKFKMFLCIKTSEQPTERLNWNVNLGVLLEIHIQLITWKTDQTVYHVAYWAMLDDNMPPRTQPQSPHLSSKVLLNVCPLLRISDLQWCITSDMLSNISRDSAHHLYAPLWGVNMWL